MMKIAKLAGAALGGCLLIVGAASARAGHEQPALAYASPAPLPAPPALTAADLQALREHIDAKFNEVNARADGFNGRLSNIEGYMQAQRDATIKAGH